MARALAILIHAGHTLDNIWGYTLTQVYGFTELHHQLRGGDPEELLG